MIQYEIQCLDGTVQYTAPVQVDDMDNMDNNASQLRTVWTIQHVLTVPSTVPRRLSELRTVLYEVLLPSMQPQSPSWFTTGA